jgi:hypothetical protein
MVVIGHQHPTTPKGLEASSFGRYSHLPTAAVDIRQEARRALSRRWRRFESGRGYTATPPSFGGV